MLLIISLALAPMGLEAATQPCSNRISGTWNFGSAPSACNVSPLQSASLVRSQYSMALFSDARAAQGRPLYMSEMYPVLRETAKYYIHRRNPRVGPAEEEAFILALMALAHQETYWTHYREGQDGILRFMRGDSLHGYGLMQVDDRSHSAAINAGKGVDLVENMIYGLDVFYSGWIKSASISCVNSASNFTDRTRAAWSAYNGGPRAICRWTDSSSSWAQSDINFKKRLDDQSWRPLVKDFAAPSKLDIRCMAEGKRPCRAGVKKPVMERSKSTLHMARLKPDLRYRFLRQCPGSDCDFVAGAVRSGSEVGVVSEPENGWVEVQHVESSGWIRREDLQAGER